MLVHSVLYTSCIYESAYDTLSLWTTKKGAFKARQKFLREAYTEWYENRIIYGKSEFKFMQYADIKLGTQEVFEE